MVNMSWRGKALPIAILVLFVMQSASPFIGNQPILTEDEVVHNTSSVPFSNGSGHDLAGTTLTLDGVDWTVRQESNFDLWNSYPLLESSDSKDLLVLPNGEVLACSLNAGQTSLIILHLNDTISEMEIDSSSVATTFEQSCSIAVNDLGRIHVAYTMDNNLKVARLAVENAVYFEPTWHIRTIENESQPLGLEMVIDSDEKMHILYVTDTGLEKMSFNKAFWEHSILEKGDIGTDLEIEIDESDMLHIVYVEETEGEVRLLRTDGSQITKQVLARGTEIMSHVAMDLDSNSVEQLVYSSGSDVNNTSLSLVRSLVGEDEGRINPNAKWSLSLDDDSEEGIIASGDLNGDGRDDLVYTIPDGNGTVSIHYGSADGPSDYPDKVLVGENADSSLGTGLAIGDWNCDGYDDIAVSEPGLANNSSGHVWAILGGEFGLENSSWWNMTGEDGDGLGWSMTSMGDVENDGCDDLAIVANSTIVSTNVDTGNVEEQGKVVLLRGNSSGLQNYQNLTQTLNGPQFGRVVVGGGDYNGDGHSDLAISNTGSVDSPTGYSSLEVFAGGTSGIDPTPIQSEQILLAGKLFGAAMACVGDIDGDGNDDLLLSELYADGGLYHSGKIHLFTGSSNGPTSTWTLRGSYANANLGTNLAPAGDVNEDGYDDFLVMQLPNSNSGKVELFLGGPNGVRSDVQLFAEGATNEHLGLRLLTGMDLDGDGMGDLAYSTRDLTRGDAFGPEIVILTERDWEFIDFSINTEISDISMGTSARGTPSILVDITGQDNLLIEHILDGTPGGKWSILSMQGVREGLIDVSPAGKPYIFNNHGTGTYSQITTPIGQTILEKDLVTSGSMGQMLGGITDDAGKQRLAFASEPMSQILYSEEGNGSWSSSLVRGSIDIRHPIDVHVDSNGNSNLIYVNDDGGQIEIAELNSTWSLSQLTNTTVGDDFDSLWLDDDGVIILQVGMVENDSWLQFLEFSAENETGVRNHTVTDIAQVNTTALFEVDIIRGDQLALVYMDGNTMQIDVRNLSGGNWTNEQNIWLGNHDTNRILAMDGGAVLHDSNGSSHGTIVESNGSWNSITHDVPASTSGIEYTSMANHWYATTTNANGNLVLTFGANDGGIQFSHTMEAIFASGPAPISEGLEESAQIAYFESVNEDVILLRTLLDKDRDMIPNLIDEKPRIGDQWYDSDGDGYGDNDLGPMADSCPSTFGPSSIQVFGCNDFDLDGWTDAEDDCVNDDGMSWWGRYGCADLDQDGWSDNDATWIGGDRFGTNWKQALDSDLDGYGDNHGPDCCNTEFDNKMPDLFPYNNKQWEDNDGDGYGDNSSDFETGDQCPWEEGYSWRDRLGCYDSDGDGASDPSNIGKVTEWNESHGADWWPSDGTQWADSDGDGFGDNDSEGATTPDKFPTNEAAANDTDGDGFPNNWTSLKTANNTQGLEIDSCPNVWGNSTNPQWGCVDSDGDGMMDAADDFPFDSTQVQDSDGDGWGDNQQGTDPDKCPFDIGVWNGTLGAGCPLINNDDDDADLVPNEYDECPDTEAGLLVDSVGCADNQKDDDQDGVNNHLDLCPDSAFGSVVDSDGCTLAQKETDTDEDGVMDPDDICPNSDPEDEVDDVGCNPAQRDDDGDGISNAEDMQCPDTPEGYPIYEEGPDIGCTDETQLDVDFDGDGWLGDYSYDQMNDTHTGDAFPVDSTQWQDRDGDGYGDNASGNNADDCPDQWGNSTERDTLGCTDTDGDGFQDSMGHDAFPNDPTQWLDEDFDGYGDNASGNLPDLCPGTNPSLKFETIGYSGCSKSQRDSDGDGVTDDIDGCDDTPLGKEVYTDGCPVPSTDGPNGDTDLIMGMEPMIFYAAAGGGALLILIVLIVIIRRLGGGDYDLDDDDDEDEDWFDDDDDEDDFMSNLLGGGGPSRGPGGPGPSRGGGGPTRGPGGPGPTRGPGGPGPSQGPGGPARGPGGPARGPGGPARGPGGPAKGPGDSGSSKPVTKKTVSGKKVRKAKVNIPSDLFSQDELADRKAAVNWAKQAISDGDAERSIMMQLQSTGWTAPQSRAIHDLAKR